MKVIEQFPAGWRVVDIGGGANPNPRADYVIDGLAYEERGALRCAGQVSPSAPRVEDRVTRDKWITLDLCERKPWPFPDKFFDYATCTHVLEDVRDPIWVCSEIRRIAKAGFISTPSRVVEQSRGVEHPLYAGYYHHRWLVAVEHHGQRGSSTTKDAKNSKEEVMDGVRGACEPCGNPCGVPRLEFRFKPHLLHATPGAIITRVGANQQINPRYAEVTLEWSGSFEAREVLCFDDQAVERELCETAARYKRLPDLKLPVRRPWLQALKRHVYFARLRWR